MDLAHFETQTRSQGTSSAVPTMNSVRIQASALSHIGKVRQKNEDQFLIGELSSSMQIGQSSIELPQVCFGPSALNLLIVADGMGGHPAGEQAAALAVTSAQSFMMRALGHIGTSGFRNTEELLRASFQAADNAVMDASNGKALLQGMGTTMTIALVGGSEAHVAHAGDSRAYLFRERALMQLTRDHTLGQAIRERRLVRDLPSSAENNAMDHIVTNVIGGGTAGVSPDVIRVDLRADDSLLLCSDGLTNMVSDAVITHLLARAKGHQEATRLLVEAALERGGKDNVTVIVAQFEIY